jgi:hypothetical protein
VNTNVPCASEEFPLTHWSAVFAAGQEGNASAEATLAEFCSTYWYPLYASAIGARVWAKATVGGKET